MAPEATDVSKPEATDVSKPEVAGVHKSSNATETVNDAPTEKAPRRASIWEQPALREMRRRSGSIHAFARRSIRNMSVEIVALIRPSRLFRTFCVPDVCMRWWDIDYQARGYELLHRPVTHTLHVLSFVAFVVMLFAGNMAANNGAAPVGLATLLALSSAYYQRKDAPFFAASVCGMWLGFYVLAQGAVSLLTPAVILEWHLFTIAASTVVLVASHAFDDAPPFINFQNADKSMPWRTWFRENLLHRKLDPVFLLMLPCSLLQEFLAPLRLLPAIVYLHFCNFAEIDEVVARARMSLAKETTFRHLVTPSPLSIAAKYYSDTYGVPPALIEDHMTATAIVSHAIPLIAQITFIALAHV